MAMDEENSKNIRLSEEQLVEVELAQREVRESKIATDADMEEVWRLFGCL